MAIALIFKIAAGTELEMESLTGEPKADIPENWMGGNEKLQMEIKIIFILLSED